MNLSEPFHSPSGDDRGADGVGHPVWRAGVLSLPVNDLPAVDYPVIQVQVSYPGATPETMANNVATPLERQFMQIPGLEAGDFQQRARGTPASSCNSTLEEPGRSRDRRAGGDHPGDRETAGGLAESADVHENQSERPADSCTSALTSDTVTEGQLYDYANTQVGERISILPGVSQVAVYGTQSAVRIKADPSAMATRDITIDDLTAAIKNGTSYTGAGQFEGEHRTFLMQPQGQLSNAEDYEQLIVGQNRTARRSI